MDKISTQQTQESLILIEYCCKQKSTNELIFNSIIILSILLLVTIAPVYGAIQTTYCPSTYKENIYININKDVNGMPFLRIHSDSDINEGNLKKNKKRGASIVRYTSGRVNKLSFTGEKGEAHSFREFHGKFLIVYFWAPWCLDCISALQQLNQLKLELIDEGINDIEIIPIAMNSGPGIAIRQIYLKRGWAALPIYVDKESKLSEGLLVQSLPTTLFVNKNAYIMARIDGIVSFGGQGVYDKILQMSRKEEIFLRNFEKTEEDCGPFINKDERDAILVPVPIL